MRDLSGVSTPHQNQHKFALDLVPISEHAVCTFTPENFNERTTSPHGPFAIAVVFTELRPYRETILNFIRYYFVTISK